MKMTTTTNARTATINFWRQVLVVAGRSSSGNAAPIASLLLCILAQHCMKPDALSMHEQSAVCGFAPPLTIRADRTMHVQRNAAIRGSSGAQDRRHHTVEL